FPHPFTLRRFAREVIFRLCDGKVTHSFRDLHQGSSTWARDGRCVIPTVASGTFTVVRHQHTISCVPGVWSLPESKCADLKRFIAKAQIFFDSVGALVFRTRATEGILRACKRMSLGGAHHTRKNAHHLSVFDSNCRF